MDLFYLFSILSYGSLIGALSFTRESFLVEADCDVGFAGGGIGDIGPLILGHSIIFWARLGNMGSLLRTSSAPGLISMVVRAKP